VILYQGDFASLGDVWQCLETFLERQREYHWNLVVEDVAEHPTKPSTVPPQKHLAEKASSATGEKAYPTLLCHLHSTNNTFLVSRMFYIIVSSNSILRG
jgi:hypothetical protein